MRKAAAPVKLIADLHIHTLASDHAWSTARENFEAAAAAGLRVAALTDHGPGMSDAPHPWHFTTQHFLPDVLCGVRLLRGAEANIMALDGHMDLSDEILGRLEFVIASMHAPCLTPGTQKEHTEVWLRVAHNPTVDCLGHIGQPQYTFDRKTVIKACRDTGVLIEINNNSFTARPTSRSSCVDIAACCAELGVPVVVNTDAHFAGSVGRFDESLSMLDEIGFPEELIVNADFDRLAAWFLRRKKIIL